MKNVIVEFRDEFREQVKSIKTEGIKKQIPNMLTFSRILSPLVIIPTLMMKRIDIAIVLLILFALTDFFDGRIARKYDCITKFGSTLDTISDKVFFLGLMIPAVGEYKILLVNLFFEILISYVNIISLSKNNQPVSSIAGKIKTACLSVTLILCYIPNIDKIYGMILGVVTTILQVIALVRYKISDINKDRYKEVNGIKA